MPVRKDSGLLPSLAMTMTKAVATIKFIIAALKFRTMSAVHMNAPCPPSEAEPRKAGQGM